MPPLQYRTLHTTDLTDTVCKELLDTLAEQNDNVGRTSPAHLPISAPPPRYH